MTIAYVQAAESGSQSNTSTTQTATLSSSPTVGNLLIAMTATSGTGTPVSMSGFTEITPRSSNFYNNGQSAQAFLIQRWYRVVQSGDGTGVATCTTSPGAYMWCGVIEYSGLGTPTITDGGWNDTTSGSESSKAVNSMTPTASAACLLISWIYVCPNYTPSAPSGWTNRVSRNNASPPRSTWQMGEQNVSSASGSYDGSWTGAGGESAWHVADAIFYAGSAGPGPRSQAAGFIG